MAIQRHPTFAAHCARRGPGRDVRGMLPAAAMALFLAQSAPAAAEPLDAANLKGFDGLITRCALSTERSFAAGMCDRLVRAAEREAGAIGMAQTHAGSVDWDGGMVTPEVPAGNEYKSPLWLTFYIRGTAGNPAGALARAAFHVPYEAAVEQAGGDAVPRAGQLVIWEDATIGNGPPKQLGPAVADAVAKKMSAVFEALGAADGN